MSLTPPSLASYFCSLTVLLVITAQSWAGQPQEQPKPSPFLEGAMHAYALAKEAYQARSDNVEVAWKLARACFDCCEFNESARADFAKEGIAACRAALKIDPKSAPTHYYLAMNLGQLARTRALGALRLVNDMEKEFLESIKLDPEFDFAGPHRNLGCLYRLAPGWPISVGDNDKSKTHLEKCVEIRPAYPDNGLRLIEAYVAWDMKAEAKELLPILEKTFEQQQNSLTGPGWEFSWSNWNQRLEEVKQKLQ